jgi:hypothetical protein
LTVFNTLVVGAASLLTTAARRRHRRLVIMTSTSRALALGSTVLDYRRLRQNLKRAGSNTGSSVFRCAPSVKSLRTKRTIS